MANEAKRRFFGRRVWLLAALLALGGGRWGEGLSVAAEKRVVAPLPMDGG